MAEPDELVLQCQKLAREIASCVPSTVKVYMKLVDDGLGMTLSSGLKMEQNVMGHANKGVSGDTIAARRASVQTRGKTQQAGADRLRLSTRPESMRLR